MPHRTFNLLKEVKETNAIATRIAAIASKEKNAAAVALGELGTNRGRNAGAKSLGTKHRPEIAKEAAKSR